MTSPAQKAAREKTCQTPDEDLMCSALAHYKRLSDMCCDYNSSIPQAIKFYFKRRNAPPSEIPKDATTVEVIRLLAVEIADTLPLERVECIGQIAAVLTRYAKLFDTAIKALNPTEPEGK